MKRIMYILSAALCFLTSCEKELTLAEKLVGDWHCTATSTDAEIYVTFTAEKTFVLWQQIGEGAFRVYNGTYELNTDAPHGDEGSIEGGEGSTAKTLLTGRYNDDTPWATDYEISIADGEIMTLTAEGISETYTKVQGDIPEEVRKSAITVVKAYNPDTVPFL